MTAERLRELGASLIRPENLLPGSKSTQKAFQGVVEIGGQKVNVRAVLNERDKRHSIHIRD